MRTDERTGPAPGEATQDDAALAEAVAGGSRAALASLFRRHRDRVYGVAFRLTGSPADAEDVLQDVFVGLGRALRRYEERGRFGSWIRGVAARVALMKVRARSRRTWQPLPETLESPAPRPDRAVDRVVVADTLEAMPESLRTVFLLKEVDGYSHAEIGHLLEIRSSASRVRLHRAWKFLEERIDGGAP